MVSDIRKILYLVPNAIFRNYNDEIVEWLDQRNQPTPSEIDAVTDQEVIDSENLTKQEAKFNQDIIKAIGLTMKDFMNEIIGGRSTDITNAELKIKFKSYL